MTRRPSGRWQACVTSEGRRRHLGTFDTIPEAEAAVIAARLKIMTNSDLPLRNRSKEAT